MAARGRIVFFFTFFFIKLTDVCAVTTNLNSIYTWHDGNQERKVRLCPDLIAEFTEKENTQLSGTSELKKKVPGSKPFFMASPKVKIWKIPPKRTISGILQQLRSKNTQQGYSPVFR